MAASSMLRLLVSFLVLIASVCINAQVPVNPKMRSFSSAIKNGHLAANQELVLYESNTGEPGVVTEQWFTGKYVPEHTDYSIMFLSMATVQ